MVPQQHWNAYERLQAIRSIEKRKLRVPQVWKHWKLLQCFHCFLHADDEANTKFQGQRLQRDSQHVAAELSAIAGDQKTPIDFFDEVRL